MSKGKTRFTEADLLAMGLEEYKGGFRPKAKYIPERPSMSRRELERVMFNSPNPDLSHEKQYKPILEIVADRLDFSEPEITDADRKVEIIARAIEKYISDDSDNASEKFLRELSGLVPTKGQEPTDHLKIVVLGEPQAQKRHRHFTGKNMKFTQVYDPSKADKKDFLSIVQDQAPDTPLDQPIKLLVHFYFSRPKSHFRTGKFAHIMKDTAPTHHTGKPDVDNCFKFATDSLTKVYWRDDSLICQTEIIKEYSDNPRTEITIIPI